MRKIKYTKEYIEPIIRSSISYKDVFRKIGIEYTNGTSAVLFKLIKKYNLDISHFTHIRKTKEIKNNCELFIKDNQIDRTVIRKRIIKEKLIEYKCHSCGCNDEWLGQKMPLILDHINGINNDDRLENLRFLCSNCDSIQPTYKNRNKTLNKEKIKIRNKSQKESEILYKKQNQDISKNNIIEQIRDSNVDFSKRGWRLELSKYLDITPQYAGVFIKKNIPDIWEICYKQNSGRKMRLSGFSCYSIIY